MPKPLEPRWRGRPVASACLRFFVFAAPILAAVGTSSLVSRHLPRVPGTGAVVVRWTIALGASTVVLLVVDRLARRLLPLAVLLRLSLAFPKEAPSRVAVARRAANVGDLAERVERARRLGVDDEPTRAAEVILALVAAVEAHDRATRGHSERVRIYSDLIAEQMRLAPSARDRLRWAALLHDVGKLEVPSRMLNKPGPLTARERKVVQKHPEEGAKLIAPMRSWLGVWARAVEDHHERFDGTGYPRGLADTNISLGGRIVAVADAYEVMTAWRPYRKAIGAAKAREELVACSGSHFDPQIVRAFLEVSVGRLRFVSGPLAWLAQAPILRGLGEAAAGAAAAAGRAASGAAVIGGVVAMPITSNPSSDEAVRHGPAPVATVAKAPAKTTTPGTNPPASSPAAKPKPAASSTRAPAPTPAPSPSDKPDDPQPTPTPAPTLDPRPTPSDSPSIGATPRPRPSHTPPPHDEEEGPRGWGWEWGWEWGWSYGRDDRPSPKE